MDEHRLRLSRANLRQALDLRSKTSFEVSEKIGRNRTYIDDFIRGRKRSISSVSIKNIASILNIAEVYIEGSRELPERVGYADTYEYWQEFEDYFHKALVKDTADPEVKQSYAKLMKDIPNIEEAVQIYTEAGKESREIFYLTPHSNVARKINVVADEWSLPKHFIEDDLHTSIEEIKILPVTDLAMWKSGTTGLYKGDYVIIDHSRHDLKNGGIFAIMIEGHILLRRVELVGDGDSVKVLCKAANPDYATFEIELGPKAMIVGRAVGHVRRL